MSGRTRTFTIRWALRSVSGRSATVAVLVVMGIALVRLAPVDPGEAATVQRGTIAVRLLETGTLRPVHSITYSSPLVGRQSEVIMLAREGDRVQAGDVIVRLGTRELDTELERAVQAVRQAEVDLRVAEAERSQAEAELDAVTQGSGALDLYEAETNLELAKKRTALMRTDYENIQPLVRNQFITRDELERLGFELEEAEAQLEVTRRRVQLLREQTRPRSQQTAELQLTQRDARFHHVQLQLADAKTRVTALEDSIASATIRARQAGLVVYEPNLSVSPPRKVREGDLVTSSQGLVTIPEVDRMLVESSVREADLFRIVPGQGVDVTVDAFPGVALEGKVQSIGTLARTTNGRFGAEKRFDIIVELSPSTADLRPEMTARLDILVGVRADVLVVPITAVFDRSGVPAVSLLKGRQFATRLVDLGDTDDVMVEVLAGLTEGDRVSLFGDPSVDLENPSPPPGS